MRIPVIYEDRELIVVDKPAGLAVHGGDGVKSQTLVDWLVKKYPELKGVGDDPVTRPGIVHRLDKDTSGVMIVARTQHAFEKLKALFKNRQVAKKYLALVVGAPKSRAGVVEQPIGRSLRNRTKRAVGNMASAARAATTRYRVLERLGGYTLVEAEPKTGRMHQIRVHLASIGCPIAGDRVYGGGTTAPDGLTRQFLHAASLSFSHPAGRRLRFEASLPNDLAAVLTSLRRLRKRR